MKARLILTAALLAVAANSFAGRTTETTVLPYNLPLEVGPAPVRGGVDFPEVPRITAQEAFARYKAGQIILVQAAGEAYDRRHIVGALDIPSEEVIHGRMEMPAFPLEGIEIVTYCY